MSKKTKILIIILAVGIVLAGGWWVWNFYYTCSDKYPELCNRSCVADSDCYPACTYGCGCLKSGEKCLSGIKCIAPFSCQCVNNTCEIKEYNITETQEVTITSDKTEYEQGETIKVTLNNKSSEDIEYWQGDEGWFSVQRLENGTWVTIKKYDPCSCGPNCEPPGFFELKTENEIWHSWNQEEDCKRSQAVAGKYRVGVKIKIDEGLQLIYSPEFTIKEKKEIVEITGFLRMIGNEPFTQLAIENLDGEIYGITGDKTNELKKLQWQKVKVKGNLMGRTPPSFRTEKSVDVIDFELVELEVTITTDKTEYEQGETVRIEIRNNLDKIIQVSGPPYFVIEKLDDGKWTQIKEYVDCPCDSPKCYMKVIGPWRAEPKSNLLLFDGTLKIRTGCEGFETIWWEASSGIYRISAEIMLNETKKTIYSPEFTIKEKQSDVIITTDKTEYEIGETVNIALSHSDKPIYVEFGTGYTFHQLKGAIWEKLTTSCETNCIMTCEGGTLKQGPCVQYASPLYYFREYNGPWEIQWNQKECIYETKLCGSKNYTEGSLKQASAGKFKVEFCYFNKEDVDLSEPPGNAAPDKKKCIEKEFTIKEK